MNVERNLSCLRTTDITVAGFSDVMHLNAGYSGLSELYEWVTSGLHWFVLELLMLFAPWIWTLMLKMEISRESMSTKLNQTKVLQAFKKNNQNRAFCHMIYVFCSLQRVKRLPIVSRSASLSFCYIYI